MLIVKHKITIGGAVAELKDKTRLIDLKTWADLDAPVNACRITLGPVEGLSFKVEDDVKVELGYGDELALVFTGKADSIDWGVDRVTVHGRGSLKTAVTARMNLVYKDKQAGDIVSDIVSKLSLTKDKVDNGVKFAAYALGEIETAYDHMRTLAAQCGFDLWANTEDKLVFAEYKAAETHEFEYGVNILSFGLDNLTTPITGVEVYGESPASLGEGDQASTWLTKKDVKGEAGGKKGIVVRMADPTARKKDTAKAIADAALAAASRKQNGELKVIGRAGVKLGDAVKVSKMPVESENGAYKVTGTAHTINPKRGFVTRIGIQEKE